MINLSISKIETKTKFDQEYT